MAEPNFATGENLGEIIAPSGNPDTKWALVGRPSESYEELEEFASFVEVIYGDHLTARSYYQDIIRKSGAGNSLYKYSPSGTSNSAQDKALWEKELEKIKSFKLALEYIGGDPNGKKKLDLLREKFLAATNRTKKDSQTHKYIVAVADNIIRYLGVSINDYAQRLIDALNDRIQELGSGETFQPSPAPEAPAAPATPSAAGASPPPGTGAGTPAAVAAAPVPTPGPPPPPAATQTNVNKEDLTARNDSDQCKISRFYEPLENIYFHNKFKLLKAQESKIAKSPYAEALQQFHDNDVMFFSAGNLKYDFRWAGEYVRAGSPAPGEIVGPRVFGQIPSEAGQDSTDYFEKLKIIHSFDNKEFNSPSVYSCNTMDQMHWFYVKNEINSFFVPELIFMKVYRERLTDNPKKFGFISKVTKIEFPLAFEDFSLSVAKENNDVSNKIRDRINQVGIKSFNWKYQGTDTFTAERDISATLVIEAESLDAIFKERQNSDGDKFRISDLILQSDCFEKKTQSGQNPSDPSPSTNVTPDTMYLVGPEGRTLYDPECYEIIVNCGNHIEPQIIDSLSKGLGRDDLIRTRGKWANLSGIELAIGSVPQEERQGYSFKPAFPEEDDKFESFRPDSFKQTLALTVVDHTFDFKDDGSVGLTVEYRARLESVMRKSDNDIALKSKTALSASKEINDKVLESLGSGSVEQQEFFNEIINYTKQNNLPSGGTYEDRYAITNWWKGTSDLNIVSVGDFYTALEGYANELRNQDEFNDKTNNSSKLQKLESAISVMRKELIFGFFKDVYKNLYLSNSIVTFKISSSELKEYLINPSLKKLKKVVEEMNREIRTGSVEKLIDLSLKDVSATLPAATAAPSTSTGGKDPKRINFVYFGDLVDIILATAEVYKTSPNLRIVLGSINLPFSTANFDTSPGKLVPYSLAAFPIALTTLNSFFTSIADGGKDRYPISALMRDLVNIVLSAATDSDCGNHFKFPSYRTRMIQFSDTNPAHYAGYKLIQRMKTDYLAINSQKYISYDELREMGERNMSLDSTDFLLITCDSNAYSDFSDGDVYKDFYKRIPHFRLGALDGLFTKGRVSKTDQPYLKEARFRDSKGNSMMQLSNVYDGYFDMIGNNLFMLGTLLYFDPTTYGPNYMGNPQQIGSLSYFMGLGGLHLVTELSHNIADNKYTTNVKARFVSRGTLKKPS